MTKKTSVAKSSPTLKPTGISEILLTLDQPQDESVVTKSPITISGKTHQDAVIIISASVGDQTVKPSQDGTFSTTLAIKEGTNAITILALLPDGKEIKKTITVTYSTESF